MWAQGFRLYAWALGCEFPPSRAPRRCRTSQQKACRPVALYQIQNPKPIPRNATLSSVDSEAFEASKLSPRVPEKALQGFMQGHEKLRGPQGRRIINGILIITVTGTQNTIFLIVNPD